MQIRHVKTILPYQDGAAKNGGMCWSPNGQKLAVATAERVVVLFDGNGEKRDKFSTKPADPKFGKKSYYIKGIAFSPDGSKIVVGQTDNIVFVYRIGDDWGDKKVICNKFGQSSSVTCLIWPSQGPIIIGLADGKVRAAHIKTNKSQTLYSTDSFVEALAANQFGTGFISGHADGTIIRFYVAEDGNALPQGKLLVHGVAPSILVWAGSMILASGCDQKLVCYSAEGRSVQQFDFSRLKNESEITSAFASSCGQMVALGSFNKIRIMTYNPRKRQWQEEAVKEIINMYTLTCLAWRHDSLYLVSSSLCGGVEMFESVAKRSLWNGRVEIVYISSSQVVIKAVSEENGTPAFNPVVLRTQPSLEIESVRIMGRENYAVARTERTLIVADLRRGLVSEIPWKESDDEKPKFHFDTPHACMIFSKGELMLVEYGVDAILERIRMEYMNPHLISIRINERYRKPGENVKRLAYLLDLKTIGISDLVTGHWLGQISHESKIDWLEMNETGRKLLFRDQKLRLYIVDVETSVKNTLIGSGCVFAEWVAGSDVIVAQSGSLLNVWYHAESIDKVQTFEIRGEVLDVVKEAGKTSVRIQDGPLVTEVQLDDQLIEFGTAIEDHDLIRALSYLEKLESQNPGSGKGLWNTLARLSLESNQLRIALRSFAALGDIAKVRFLADTIRSADEVSQTIRGDGFDSAIVQARVAILNRDLKTAERIYVDQGNIEEAVQMYRQLFQWEDAIRVADSYMLPDRHQLRQEQLKWLQETCQESAAAEVYERQGDFQSAVLMFLKAGLPSKAARLMISRDELLKDEETVRRILDSLEHSGMLSQAGELYQRIGQVDQALQCYRKGHHYAKAIELARLAFPAEVTRLEEAWGDHLMLNHQSPMAISHYIEAGRMSTALRAAIDAQQWDKAADIIEVLGESQISPDDLKLLARYYASIKQYDKAEKFYLQGQCHQDVIKMYIESGQWKRGHDVAVRFLASSDVQRIFNEEGKALTDAGKYREAEQLYLASGLLDSAISMYQSLKHFDAVVRLVSAHRPNQLQKIHVEIAMRLRREGNRRAAEVHFLAAGDWQSVVSMYRESGQWEEAFRTARSHGSRRETAELALDWAMAVGPEIGGKLLIRNGLAEECLTLACDKELFDFALAVCQMVLPQKTKEIRRRFAVHLKMAGHWQEAEDFFVKADSTRDAIDMHIQRGDWAAAEKLAEKYDPDAVSEILVARAQVALSTGDFGQFESLLLRAQKPQLLLQGYKDHGRWQDALRVAKEFLPNRLQTVQDEYDNYMTKIQGVNAASLLAQGRSWELQGEFSRAVDSYFKITPDMINDAGKLAAIWTKASELAVKFLDEDKAAMVIRNAARHLRDLGQHSTAAQLYLSVDCTREAIDVLVEARDWNRARKIAQELDPIYFPRVDSAYRDWLRSEGRADQLADVDLDGALDLLVQQGQWDQCLQRAQRHGTELLHKYVALYATELIKQQRSSAAINLFLQHGAPAKAQNINIYRHLASEFLHEGQNSYESWAAMRNMLHSLVRQWSTDVQEISPSVSSEFERFLWIFHYQSVKIACEGVGELEAIAAKISVAMLRHADLIPADRAFYEAGSKAKAVGWESLAFVLLNRFLDVADLIEENSGDATALDNSDFEMTDIPFEKLLIPNQPSVPNHLREQAKEWVLTVSLDQRVAQVLPTDERGVYEACLQDWKTSQSSLPCVLTGYPVLNSKQPVRFPGQGKVANREDWNRYLVATKRWPDNHNLHDVLKFIETWCQGLPSASSQFAF